MGKCMICGLKKPQESGRAMCKMCGMRSADFLQYEGFLFCCEKCVGHFREIMSKTPRRERKGVLLRNTVL